MNFLQINRPDIVVDSAKRVLKYESGNEGILDPLLVVPIFNLYAVWNLKEELVIASLSYGDVATAEEHLRGLVKKFPDSVRVKRLTGMVKEATGKWDYSLCGFELCLNA